MNTDANPVTVKPKAKVPSKTTAAYQSPRSSRLVAKPEKLVCRYCGSDDLAPSFNKRRDARCRACFKKRYGSVVRETKTRHALKTKGAK